MNLLYQKDSLLKTLTLFLLEHIVIGYASVYVCHFS